MTQGVISRRLGFLPPVEMTGGIVEVTGKERPNQHTQSHLSFRSEARNLIFRLLSRGVHP